MLSSCPDARPPSGRTLTVAAVLAVVLYAVLIGVSVYAVASGSDESGYFNHARLLASGSLHTRARELPGLTLAQAPSYLYVPLGMKPAPDGNGLVPTYPVGFPLMILAARPFAGWEHAADAVLLAHTLAGLLLTWWLGRALGLSRPWAFLGVCILAASPLYLFLSIRALSDVPAMVWTAAAVLAAWHARERGRWAFLAGAAFSMAVLVRPTDVLALAPLAVALDPVTGGARLVLRRCGLFLAGGLPGAVFFCLHSRAAYGRFLTTGYGNVGSDFRAGWIGISLLHYLHWIPILFTPVVFFVLALPRIARTAPRAAGTIGTWLLVYGAFYSAYSFTHVTWWFLRFILPAAPAAVVGGLLGLRRTLAGRFRTVPRHLAFGAALAAVVINGCFWTTRLYAFHSRRGDQAYPRAAAWIRAHVPANAAVLSMQTSGSLFFYSDFTLLRWDQIHAGNRATVMAAVAAGHRPLYAVLFPFEIQPALQGSVPGHWTQIHSVGQVSVWRRD
jgi:hypothetical protein